MNERNYLVAFLKACLDEDEQVARAAVGFDYGVKDWADDGDPVNVHIARHDPARTLRDIEGKRKVIGAYADALRILDGFRETGWEEGRREALELACKALAVSYADHPDYREEWRP